MINNVQIIINNLDICCIIIIENTVNLIFTCPLDYLRPYLKDDRLNSYVKEWR